MVIKTEDFKGAAKKILAALSSDRNISVLELKVDGDRLCMDTTNREFYVSVRFFVSEPVEFRAVVEARRFLGVVAALDCEEVELDASSGSYLELRTDGADYKLPLVCGEDGGMIELPAIAVDDPTVEMEVGYEVLRGVVDYNSTELDKVKNIDVNELQRLYYITEAGCFTFTTGACMFKFDLEKPVQLLLNERVVKLFKLFDTDVEFRLGHGVSDAGRVFTTVSFSNGDVYVAALVNNDERLLARMKRPWDAANGYMDEGYDFSATVDTKLFRSAVDRLTVFSVKAKGERFTPVDVEYGDGYLTLSCEGAKERIRIESASTGTYSMTLNLDDLRTVLESTKSATVSASFGNHRSVILARGPVINMVPELRK